MAPGSAGLALTVTRPDAVQARRGSDRTSCQSSRCVVIRLCCPLWAEASDSERSAAVRSFFPSAINIQVLVLSLRNVVCLESQQKNLDIFFSLRTILTMIVKIEYKI